MPRTPYAITDTDQTVVRPIIFAVTRDLCRAIGIGNAKTLPDIQYKGETLALPTRNGTIDEEARDIYNRESNITLEANIEPVLEDGKNQAPGRNQEPFLFQDSALGVFVRPVHTSKQVILTIEYRANTPREMQTWLNQMRVYAQAGRDQLHHTVKYHYNIPSMIKFTLYKCWELREAVEGYGDTFADWFKGNMTPSMTQVANISGGAPQAVISESQIDIQGTFNFVAAPDRPEVSERNGASVARFEYTFRFDHPDMMVISHPILIHNQLLPAPLIQPPESFDFATFASHGTLFQEAFYSLGGRILAPNGGNGLVIPTGDDWLLPYRPTGYYPVVRFLQQIDPADPTFIMNLRDIGSVFTFNDALLAFSERQYAALTVIHDTPLLFLLYDGDGCYFASAVTIDSNLDLRAAAPLSLRGVYHVQVFCLGEMSRLPTFIQEDLRCHPQALQAIYEFLTNTPLTLPDLLGNGCLTKDAYNDIIASVDPVTRVGQRPINGYTPGRPAWVMRTVNVSSIVTLRK